VLCANLGTDALVLVDPDGSAGPALRRPVVLLKSVGCTSLTRPDNLRL
jgi:hypothetical protein